MVGDARAYLHVLKPDIAYVEEFDASITRLGPKVRPTPATPMPPAPGAEQWVVKAYDFNCNRLPTGTGILYAQDHHPVGIYDMVVGKECVGGIYLTQKAYRGSLVCTDDIRVEQDHKDVVLLDLPTEAVVYIPSENHKNFFTFADDGRAWVETSRIPSPGERIEFEWERNHAPLLRIFDKDGASECLLDDLRPTREIDGALYTDNGMFLLSRADQTHYRIHDHPRLTGIYSFPGHAYVYTPRTNPHGTMRDEDHEVQDRDVLETMRKLKAYGIKAL